MKLNVSVAFTWNEKKKKTENVIDIRGSLKGVERLTNIWKWKLKIDCGEIKT